MSEKLPNNVPLILMMPTMVRLEKRELLSLQIWRAVRMIVDTGLHYTGMKRDEAIKMFADNAWDDSDFTQKEVRMSVMYSSEKDAVRNDCLCASA